MKSIVLFCLLCVTIVQTGCATGPSINQRSLQHQQEVESHKKSDDFAKSLSQ